MLLYPSVLCMPKPAEEKRLAKLRQLAAEKPNYSNYYKLGMAYQKLGAYDEACDAFEQTLKFKVISENLIACGAAKSILSQDKDAFKYFNQAVANASADDMTPWLARGDYHYHCSMYLQAITDFTHVLNHEDNNKAHYLRALCYFKLKKFKNALKDCEYLCNLKMIPKYVYLRGEVYYELKKYREALQDFDAVISNADANSEYLLERGITHFAMKNYRKAYWDFSYCIRCDAGLGFSFGYYYRGLLNIKLKRFAKANHNFSRYNVDDPTTALNLANVEYQRGELSESLRANCSVQIGLRARVLRA